MQNDTFDAPPPEVIPVAKNFEPENKKTMPTYIVFGLMAMFFFFFIVLIAVISGLRLTDAQKIIAIVIGSLVIFDCRRACSLYLKHARQSS